MSAQSLKRLQSTKKAVVCGAVRQDRMTRFPALAEPLPLSTVALAIQVAFAYFIPKDSETQFKSRLRIYDL